MSGGTQSATKRVSQPYQPSANYASRIPGHIATNGQRVIVVDPRVHVWGAYDANGDLLKSGLASAGSGWCSDLRRPCRTKVGTFHIQSLGNASCKSSIFPMPHGGAPMPYCMFFNGSQGLHGSPSSHVVEGNVSHGCVRVNVADAEWIRFNFANIGTKVVVKPY
jgi:lipoprotein-anchoring transpeptidase ErfK/SrfK